MRDLLEEALRGHNADYIEIRIEESESTHILYHGRELEEIGTATGVGGCVRAAVRGGWGFVSFNTVDRLKEKVALAVRQAAMVGTEKTLLAEVPPTVETVPIHVPKDPLKIPLRQKKELLDQYVDIIWSTPGIQTSSAGYGDSRRKTTFANSIGSFITQEQVHITFRVSATARDKGDVQQASLSLGSLGDFSLVERLHSQVGELAGKSTAMLKAPPVKGGEYTVILDPILAGVFIHEAFGHLSEADHVYENQKLREIMVLGRRFGGPHLNVVDGAAIPGLRGSYKYDDEGAPATKTYLIREGTLVGRLHSRETAAKMGEQSTGNARAINHNFPPIVRMTNTLIEPGNATLEELLADVKEGVYCHNWYGGMTSMEQFTFSAGEAHMIRNGRIAEMVRPVLLSGNLFTTLENLDAIANDLGINQGGGCGKNGQFPLAVSNGSPHIRIRKLLVGGR